MSAQTIAAFALLLVVGVAYAVPARTELDCTSLANGVYPNVHDCSTFYKCSNGYTYLYDCPANLLFDKIDLQCEWPQLARCANDDCSTHRGGELHGVIGCHGHAYGDLYPDPYDCHYFYHCAHGAGGTIEAHHKVCPANLHFNNELKVCDWPENAGCKACGPEPTQAPTQAPTNAPTQAPTNAPTHAPTNAPTQAPTDAPTHAPTQAPTNAPTHAPTNAPTDAPTQAPTTARPTTARPTTTVRPTTGRPTTTARPTTTRRTTTRRPPGGGSSSEESSEESNSSSSEENLKF